MNFYQQDNARKAAHFEALLEAETRSTEEVETAGRIYDSLYQTTEDTFYKVYVRACGETSYCTNGLDFNTAEEARDYGNDLLGRWFGADRFEVLRVNKNNHPQQISGTDARLLKE